MQIVHAEMQYLVPIIEFRMEYQYNYFIGLIEYQMNLFGKMKTNYLFIEKSRKPNGKTNRITEVNDNGTKMLDFDYVVQLNNYLYENKLNKKNTL